MVWLLILLVEVPVNQGIAGGEDSLFDSFYWSFGSLFDPGGPGKGPVSLGGKLILVAHWFLITIILATYCGALGAFLATGSAKPWRHFPCVFVCLETSTTTTTTTKPFFATKPLYFTRPPTFL